MRILIIEDEYTLADIVATNLKKEKYIVDISTDGEDGLYNALSGIYDLIILDVMLPKINGFDILKEIRNSKINSKVIMLTAKSELDDKLYGFDNGSDDYLTKPFHMEELIARINVQLRKTNISSKSILQYGDLQLDLKNSKLICKTNNESIDLVCKEFQLVEYFMTNPNQVISKDQIYDKIWGLDNILESNNLEVYLSFIRKKLKSISSNVNIKSLRGLGYKMVIDNEKTKN